MSTTNNPWDDPRITAYVMNELSPTETAEFEAAMQRHPELAKAVDEARRVAEKLSVFYAAMPAATLDAERREQITGAAISQPDRSYTDAGYSGRMIAMWAIAASILILAVALPLSRMSTIRTAGHSDAESTSSQVRIATEPQLDRVKPSETEADVSPRSSSMLEVVESPEPAEVRMSLSATNEKSQLAEAPPMLKSARARVMSSPPPSAPFHAPAPVAKKNREMAGRGANMKTMPTEMDSGVDGMAEQMDTLDAGAMMGRNAIPAETYHRNPKTETAAEMRAKPTDQGTGPGAPGDKFSPLGENEFRRVSEHPLSTFSIDVDTASYAKVRSYLQSDQLPRPASVRIEEMVNYFDYDYTGPTAIDGESTDPFSAAMTTTICPWNPEHRLVRVGLQAKRLTEQERPQCNLVFLIDTSGSMSQPNKLPLVTEGLKILLDELRDDDRVAIVVYAGSAGLVLDSTPVEERQRIARALTELRAGGSTNGVAGLQLAYSTAREHFIQDGVNRVILCSDGDFNVGITGTDALVAETRAQAKSGIDLTVLGFGMGNHNDAMLEKTSNDAEGNYAFVDTIAEARKVLVDQLSGTLVTVAKDVKIQIEFNPAVVSAYRLIGYENRLLATEDFNDDRKDAGEIGAGHQVTALYEVVPVGAKIDAIAPPVDPLKYQPEPVEEAISTPTDDDVATSTSSEMLTLKLRYKQPQGTKSKLMTRVLDDSHTPFDQADGDFRFAASVAAFGMLLRDSALAGNWTYDQVRRVAERSIGSDPHGLRSEFVGLVKTAETLAVGESAR